MERDATYRLVVLGLEGVTGQTAATAELAKLLPPDIDRAKYRLGLECTDWGDHYGKPRAMRTVLIEAESHPGEWEVGV
jgi:hypothetical protein